MGAAPLPPDEADRLRSLRARAVLDTPPEKDFDDIVRLAAEICNVPIALVSLVDEHRQWFKAKVGIDVAETPREVAYCAHAILGDDIMEVPEAGLDQRFVDNPLREGPTPVEFYAGVPLKTGDGHRLGTLCVADHMPRRLSDTQRVALEALAAQVVELLEARRPAYVATPVPATASTEEDAHEAPPAHVNGRGSRLALGVAFLLALGSIGASAWVDRSVQSARRARLAQAALRAERFLEGRTGAYVEVLRGASALFAASDRVTEGEFARYVATLRLERNYRDVLGLGFVQRVPRSGLDAFLAEARATNPEYTLRVDSGAAELAVIRYVEPLASNEAALGFDMRSSPARTRALATALRTRSVAVTDRVTLRQDPRGGPGFLFLAPAIDEREVHVGWVFAVVRGRALVAGLDHAAGDSVVTIVHDAPDEPPLAGPAEVPHGERVDTDIEVGDRRFALTVVEGAHFSGVSERLAPHAVLFLGLCAAALSFALVGALRRVEARSKALATAMTESLRQRSRELREVIDGTADLVLAFERDGRITLANRAFRHALGHVDAVARGLSVLDVVHEPARAAFARALEELGSADGEARRTIETTFVTRDGAPIDVEGALTFAGDETPPVTRAIFRDVSARNHAQRTLKAANTALERLASVDALTGVANRRAFDEKLREELARAKRHGGPLSLVMIDVDFFKLYNDRYGHPAGDECLRRVGACLRAIARRAGELAARYGGEEFALLLPGADLASALETAERLRAAIEAMALPHERNPVGVVTASFGVATFGGHHDDAENGNGEDGPRAADFVAQADRALYTAKSGGRNRVAC